MKATTTHATMIHAICPHGGWDYYEVTFRPAEFVTVEDFQAACDNLRGTTDYQETLTEKLSDRLPAGTLTTEGRHGMHDLTRTRVEVTK